VVDVRDPDAVLAACQGMDAIVNCTVVRHDPVDAWRVNLLGAYNILRAAVARGIRRVVQTGPCLVSQPGAAGYTWDDLVGDDAPPRPGHDRYLHTKYLAQELCRAFAEYHGLEVPVLLFGGLASSTVVPRGPVSPFFVSWTDAGRAIRHALEVPSLPTPCEVMHITGDLPHGVFPNRKAKYLLGWQPRDTLERWYAVAPPERESGAAG
jgi:nucleoside-diphosphate-sugar epimerase